MARKNSCLKVSNKPLVVAGDLEPAECGSMSIYGGIESDSVCFEVMNMNKSKLSDASDSTRAHVGGSGIHSQTHSHAHSQSHSPPESELESQNHSETHTHSDAPTHTHTQSDHDILCDVQCDIHIKKDTDIQLKDSIQQTHKQNDTHGKKTHKYIHTNTDSDSSRLRHWEKPPNGPAYIKPTTEESDKDDLEEMMSDDSTDAEVEGFESGMCKLSVGDIELADAQPPQTHAHIQSYTQLELNKNPATHTRIHTHTYTNMHNTHTPKHYKKDVVCSNGCKDVCMCVTTNTGINTYAKQDTHTHISQNSNKVYTHGHTITYAQSQTHPHTPTLTHTATLTHTPTFTHTPTLTHTPILTHTPTQTHTHTQAHIHTPIQNRTPTRLFSPMPYTYTQANTPTPTHIQTHKHRYTHTPTHTPTRAHTHMRRHSLAPDMYSQIHTCIDRDLTNNINRDINSNSHTPTHTQTCINTQVIKNIPMQPYPYFFLQGHGDACTQPLINTYTQTQKNTHTHTQTHTHTHKHTRSQSQCNVSDMHTPPQTQKKVENKHKQSYLNKDFHTQTQIPNYIQTYTHKRSQTTQVVPHTHTNSKTHKNKQQFSYMKFNDKKLIPLRKLSAGCHCQFDVWEVECMQTQQRFALKILDLQNGDVNRLKYKKHSLIEEGKQLESLYTQFHNLYKQFQRRQYINKYGNTLNSPHSHINSDDVSYTQQYDISYKNTYENKYEYISENEIQNSNTQMGFKQNLNNNITNAELLANTRPLPIPKFMWTSVGEWEIDVENTQDKNIHTNIDGVESKITTKESNNIPQKKKTSIMGVAMEAIKGHSLTQILQQIRAPNRPSAGLLVLEIAVKIVEAQRVLSTCLQTPIVNWDTKPGNILLELYRSEHSNRLHCKRAVIVDLGDALPGPTFDFPTKHRPGQTPGYIICTKGYCAPECAMLVFLLASMPKCAAFRKVWYGEKANLERMQKSRMLRFQTMWHEWLSNTYLKPQSNINGQINKISDEANAKHKQNTDTHSQTERLSPHKHTHTRKSSENYPHTQATHSRAHSCQINNTQTHTSTHLPIPGCMPAAGTGMGPYENIRGNTNTYTNTHVHTQPYKEKLNMETIEGHWDVKFSQASVAFSTGLVLSQLFGGPNLLQLAQKEEGVALDLLCEWNCKTHTNTYSNRPNVGPDDLLPTLGVFSTSTWRKRLSKLLHGCLAFDPEKRWTFVEMEAYLKQMLHDFHKAYAILKRSQNTS